MKNEKETAVLTAQEKENQLNEVILREVKEFVKWNFDGIKSVPLNIAHVQFEFVNLLSSNNDYTSDAFSEELFTLKLLFEMFESISKSVE